MSLQSNLKAIFEGVLVVSVLAGVCHYLLPGFLDFQAIPPKQDVSTMDVLKQFFLVSLLVERFLELFVRDTECTHKEALKRETTKLRSSLTLAISHNGGDAEPTDKGHPVNKLRDRVKAKHNQLVGMNHQRQTHVSLVGFVAGFAISVMGLRVLSELFDTTGLTSPQKEVFTFTDIVLTASVFVGGSDGMHQLIKQLQALLKQYGAASNRE
eukprot:INCI758.1.p1 GENE.INCI758.1~~INCI758.1.p1  ORF type:complete len:211 (-),score=34.10 INCI758.1:67-699(-)